MYCHAHTLAFASNRFIYFTLDSVGKSVSTMGVAYNNKILGCSYKHHTRLTQSLASVSTIEQPISSIARFIYEFWMNLFDQIVYYSTLTQNDFIQFMTNGKYNVEMIELWLQTQCKWKRSFAWKWMITDQWVWELFFNC